MLIQYNKIVVVEAVGVNVEVVVVVVVVPPPILKFYGKKFEKIYFEINQSWFGVVF
jgi:hypothetical protein